MVTAMMDDASDGVMNVAPRPARTSPMPLARGHTSSTIRGVTVENFCSVGRYCKLESECYITAYSTLEDRVFIAPGVVTSNDNFVGRTQERFKHFKGVTVKRGARVGAGTVTLPGVTIGEDALVAARALELTLTSRSFTNEPSWM